MTKHLEDLGIKLLEPELVEHYFTSLRSIFVHDIGKPNEQGLILDLDSLPQKPPGLKDAIIKWLISANLSRLKNGEDPIITLQLVMRCPVWKIVHPPLKRITLTKEKMFNKPTIKTVGKKQVLGSINKKR